MARRKLPPWKLAALPGGRPHTGSHTPRPWEHDGFQRPVWSRSDLRMKCRQCRETTMSRYIRNGLCGQCRAENVVNAETE
jgi:hypothetical protein